MTERQKDRLLYYIACLDRSAFNLGLVDGVDILSPDGCDDSFIKYDKRHDQAYEQLLNFVNSIYEGEPHETAQ